MGLILSPGLRQDGIIAVGAQTERRGDALEGEEPGHPHSGSGGKDLTGRFVLQSQVVETTKQNTGHLIIFWRHSLCGHLVGGQLVSPLRCLVPFVPGVVDSHQPLQRFGWSPAGLLPEQSRRKVFRAHFGLNAFRTKNLLRLRTQIRQVDSRIFKPGFSF
jgi:hypothetical protein